MPTRPPRACPRCGQKITGSRCFTCHPPWQNKPTAWAGGSTRRWRRFREAWLIEHPLCVWRVEARAECGRVATDVDHIRNLGTFPEGPEREAARFDPGNVQSLCREHHEEKTVQEALLARQRARDPSAGQEPPAEPAHPGDRPLPLF